MMHSDQPAAADQRPPEVAELVDSITDEVAALEEAAEAAAARLQAVLPEGPGPVSENVPQQEYRSPLGRHLGQVLARLQQVRQQLRHTVEDLEL